MTVPTDHARPFPAAAVPRVWSRGLRRLGLPSGLPLGSPAWRRRHATALAAGTAGLPALAVLGGVAGRALPAVLGALLGPAVLLAAAGVRVLPPRVRTALSAAGVTATCCTAVWLSPATTEVHFAFFGAAVLVGLYRDWAAYPVAVTVALLWPDAAGTAAAVAAVPGTGVLHAALVVAGAAVTLVGWALADVSTRSPAAPAWTSAAGGTMEG